MLSGFLGGIGLGLVWGWLLGLVWGRMRRPSTTIPSLAAAILAQALVIRALTGWLVTAAFLLAAGLSFLVHVGWRRQLSERFGAHPTSKEDT